MKRLLVTGGSGMLGSWTAARAVSAGWETWGTRSGHQVEVPGCRMVDLDIRDREAVANVLNQIRPDVVVHTAAIPKPDLCEEQKSLAFAINTVGAHNIVLASEAIGAHLVHVSTDLVFSGERNPIKEDETLSPPNYYGLTKAAAEGAVRSMKKSAVVRTSVIYGPTNFPHQESFSDRVIGALSAGLEFGAYIDQSRAAIPAWNLADVLLEIAERGITGIFHAVCPEPTSRFHFAKKVAEIFSLDDRLLVPLYMDETPSTAKRPKMLVLDPIATSRALETRLLGFEEGIQELKKIVDK